MYVDVNKMTYNSFEEKNCKNYHRKVEGYPLGRMLRRWEHMKPHSSDQGSYKTYNSQNGKYG